MLVLLEGGSAMVADFDERVPYTRSCDFHGMPPFLGFASLFELVNQNEWTISETLDFSDAAIRSRSRCLVCIDLRGSASTLLAAAYEFTMRHGHWTVRNDVVFCLAKPLSGRPRVGVRYMQHGLISWIR